MAPRFFDNGANSLLECLESGNNISKVTFPRTSDPDLIDRLCNAIKKNKSVRKLNLSEVEFEQEELAPKLGPLVDALKESRITSVRLNLETEKKHKETVAAIKNICQENTDKWAKDQGHAETNSTPTSPSR
jgi:ribosomal protein S8